MDDKPVFQNKVKVFGNGHIVNRDFFGERNNRNVGDGVASAELLPLPDVVCGDIFSVCIHDKVRIRAAHGNAVLHSDYFQLVDVFLNADFFCNSGDKLLAVLIVGFHSCRGNALIDKLRERHRHPVLKLDARFTGEAAGSAENKTVWVLQELAVNT